MKSDNVGHYIFHSMISYYIITCMRCCRVHKSAEWTHHVCSVYCCVRGRVSVYCCVRGRGYVFQLFVNCCVRVCVSVFQLFII
jgi:hypothetical protein